MVFLAIRLLFVECSIVKKIYEAFKESYSPIALDIPVSVKIMVLPIQSKRPLSLQIRKRPKMTCLTKTMLLSIYPIDTHILKDYFNDY